MQKKISIEGMSCQHCVMHVKDALLEVGGKNIEVSLENKNAVGDFEDTISNDSIKSAIEDAGYDVVDIETL